MSNIVKTTEYIINTLEARRLERLAAKAAEEAANRRERAALIKKEMEEKKEGNYIDNWYHLPQDEATESRMEDILEAYVDYRRSTQW